MLLTPRRGIDLCVVHHSASANDVTAAEIGRWHAKKWKFGVGYHRLIEADGYAVDGRRRQRTPAANRPHNGRTIAVCVIGDNTRAKRSDADQFVWTDAQERQLIRELVYWTQTFPGMRVAGHRDLPGTATACPGIDIAAWCQQRELDVPLLVGG